MELYDYQEHGVTAISHSVFRHRKSVFQLPTGGGKTVTFAAICERYIKKNMQCVLIVVHRQELLEQALKTLSRYNIRGQKVTAGMRYIPPARVYVAMVESLVKRIPKIDSVGMVIIDETHRGEFKKLHQHFPDQLIIGFTATPLASSKKDPLKNYYSDIVCGPSIPELIKMGCLCQNHTYSVGGINRKKFKVTGGDFNEHQMGEEFSRAKHIQNAVKAYQQHADGTKCAVFNCTIEHSLLVKQAFLEAGYDCRHVDGGSEDRKETFEWFENTPGAILCNVGIATTGWDSPSCQTILVNRSILSLPLWIQICGRGSRLHESKRFFTILDLGDNVKTHFDWNFPHDWKDMFFNPPEKKRDGVAPVKDCEQCGAIIPLNVRVCPYCGFEYPPPSIEEETKQIALQLVTENINLEQIIAGSNHAKRYNPFYRIGFDIIDAAVGRVKEMTPELAAKLHDEYQNLAREYIHSAKQKYTPSRREKATKFFYAELSKKFNTFNNSSMRQSTRDLISALIP